MSTSPFVPFLARPLLLSSVRLTGGPLHAAQQLTRAYLLRLEPDRMLAFYRIRAGLTAKADGYGGWDGDGRNLTGHIAGHYLSAVSLMYTATGDDHFKERADYLVQELQTVQNAHGDGYLGALENGREAFSQVSHGDIRSGGFDLNGLWAPWYVLHKLFAGLRDAYRHTGNGAALAVETRFAGWVEGILAPLDDAQRQRMLNTEFGGMNEVLADLYTDTGDDRWLALSHKFDHDAVMVPLSEGKDILAGLHGNTQIPKFLGALSRYLATGDAADSAAAHFFWERVVGHHSFATGGHGKEEYFFAPDKIADYVDGNTAESCNVYNLLKMTRTLFALHPGEPYAAFHERALFNHVLGSIHPGDGRTCYMVPVGTDVYHEYQDMENGFTCCVGTGMESHALHGDGLYYESGDMLWVNLYAPSTARWDAAGVGLRMETSFPDGDDATLTLTLDPPRAFSLMLRRPGWAGDGFTISVNGQAVDDLPAPGNYVRLERTWQSGDTLTLTLPKALHLEPTPNDPRRVAVLWGPLVLAADLGPEPDEKVTMETRYPPVFVAADRPVAEWLIPVAEAPGTFRTAGVARVGDDDTPQEVTFVPFYRLHDRAYSVYVRLYTPDEWDAQAASIASEQERQHRLKAATVAFVQPGEMQPERDFNFQGEDSYPDRLLGRAGRNGRRWLSFDIPVDPTHPLSLIVTYHGGERRRAATFDLLVDGAPLATQTIPKSDDKGFYDVEYPLPSILVDGKQQITVRFQIQPGSEIATLFGLRIVRADLLA